MSDNGNAFFARRPGFKPMVYAYADNNPQYRGMLKVGYTEKSVEQRVAEQYPTKRPGKPPYRIVFAQSAVRLDGSAFRDHELHAVLESYGKQRLRGADGRKSEWFRCSVSDVQAAWQQLRGGGDNPERRTESFPMREEQAEAVEKTFAYFAAEERARQNRAPRFLWNAKMRFGKTFTAYQLARKLQAKRVLIFTFKPAVENAWEEDLNRHIDFTGWQFISRNSKLTYDQCDRIRPIVCFGSFQDYLGKDANGRIKPRNEWVHTINWDLVIFDEYHFGAWRDNAKKLFETENEDDYDDFNAEDCVQKDPDSAFCEDILPITARRYLFLSGTPFRALNSGEFIEEQIFNWTYSDEQQRKAEWAQRGATENPYAAMPRMVMMTYRIPESIREIALRGENNEFDLNEFFAATGSGKQAWFVHESYVQMWLDLIRGAHLPTAEAEMRLGHEPVMPYADVRLLQLLTHTLWFLPSVAGCQAMANLLGKRHNAFYHDYRICVCAGAKAGIGIKALETVHEAMDNPMETKTITLSCGKLTTGVTIRPWSGIFMLRNLSSPETYFQAAFRVQSPWTMTDERNQTVILKRDCYIFDFALERALRQIGDYSTRLSTEEMNPEQKVEAFIHFLPVLAYEGSKMRSINAEEILDIAMSGTSATLLAKRWESALLVNVDNYTLSRLMASAEAMDALNRIEGFRSIRSDIEFVINHSREVRNIRRERGNLNAKEKRKLSEEEKEYKSRRKQIQEKLLKFATRIPVFMYLSDYREMDLHDLIVHVETSLFERTTGLNVNDFELLLKLKVFNSDIISNAIYKFKCYEDSSLNYTGLHRQQSDK